MSTEGEIRRNQIDRYVTNQMNKEERTEFEKRMRDHVALAESVHMHRDVLVGVEYYFLKELKQELINSDQQKPKSKIRTYLAIAASILLLAGAGITFYFLNIGVDSDSLFITYFEPYPNIVAPVTRSSESSSYEEVMQLYETEQYAEAIPKLNELIQNHPDSVELVFYRGISYLGVDQPKNAATDFTAVIKASKKAFLEPSYWYLGLSQLKIGKIEEAQSSFQMIRETKGALAKQASEILEDMK